MAGITYEGDVQRSAPTATSLFGGQKLWFSQAVPSRTRLMQEAAQNGAQIVQLEQQADVKIVDHARKNQAPGTHSYKYVDLSIRNGTLEDLEAHRVGSVSRVDRPIGSVVTASKGGRNKFTEAEDQLLWNWVQPFVQSGGAWKGNEIYKQLELVNPNHTYQSWRDRWLKHTQHQKRQITEQHQTHEQANDDSDINPRPSKRRHVETLRQAQKANIGIVQSRGETQSQQAIETSTMGNTGSTQAAAYNTVDDVENGGEPRQILTSTAKPNEVKSEQTSEVIADEVQETAELAFEIDSKDDDAENSVSADSDRLPLAFNFTQNEARMLYKAACHILDAKPEKLDGSWAGVAKQYGHTKDTWRTFFYEFILPEYRKNNGLHTEAEQEAHVKAWVAEERTKKDRDSEARRRGETAIDQSKNKIVDVEAIQSQILGIREAPKTSSLTLDGTADQSQPLDAERYRSPQPNESRKIRASTSSQSTLLSTSQPSQISQPLRSIVEDPAALSKQSQQTPSSQGRLQDDSSDSREHKRRKLDPHIESATIASQSRISEEQEEVSSQFVTQASHGVQSSFTEDSDSLQDIPYRAPLPAQSSAPVRLSFMTEEHGTSLSASAADPDRGLSSRLPSSPPGVQLVEGEEVEFDDFLHSSNYAPSETQSEGEQFDEEIQLNQAWETAPESPVDEQDVENDGNAAQSDDEVRQELSQPQQSIDEESQRTTTKLGDTASSRQTPRKSPNRSIRKESTEGDFETAPMSPRTDTRSGISVVDRSDTQALFCQPTQLSFSEMAAIPEPPEGWEDDELVEADKIDRHQVGGTDAAPVGDTDWTLPLPDPDLVGDGDDVPASPARESEADEVETWLATQGTIYPSLPDLLFKHLSYRALETTSMDFGLATSVLAVMVHRFDKGKYPAHEHQSLEDILQLSSSSSKRQRQQLRKALASVVDALIPTDLKGCWTPEDDSALLGVDARAVKRVQDKHGPARVRTRFAYLESWHNS